MIENIPWTKKYRPTVVSELMVPDRIKQRLDTMVTARQASHLLLLGSTGCGKTSAARVLLETLGMSIIEEDVCLFGKPADIEKRLLELASGPGTSLFCQEMAVILEGVDSLRVSSQKLLAALLQKTELSWVLIGNDKKKIIPALQTFCTVLEFTTTEGAESDAVRGAFGARLLQIVAAEGFSCSHAVVDRALADHLPDLRKTLAEVDWAVRTPQQGAVQTSPKGEAA